MDDKNKNTEKEDKSKENKDTKKNKDEAKEQELSEEDKQLQEELNMLVERLTESDQSLYKPALESLRSQIRASTTSMTSVPKPLKFLRPHYETLKEVYEKIKEAETKRFCADIISVLGMTISDGRESLKFRLIGSKEAIGSWGHEYVRHLAGQVALEWQETEETNTQMREKLLSMTKEIVPYHMGHNAEAEACDLLMEIERLDLLKNYVDENAYPRVCLYLTSCVPYVPDPENLTLLKTAVELYRKFNQYPQALRFAMQLNDMKLVEEIFLSCKELMMQKQLAYMLGRQQIFLELSDDVEENDELMEIMSNAHLNNNFLALARELDIMEPKVPEDIYKSHLEPNRSTIGPSNIDSARQNLASSFVNGFVNAAFGQDKLLIDDGNKWIYKNKDHGMLSATASLGLILLWDVDGGLTQIDKYLYSSDDFIKLLAVWQLVNLGLAYAGSNREDVLTLILPVLGDSKSSMEVVGMASLSCGLISVGSCNGDVTSTILQTMMERSEADLKETYSKYLALGKQDAVDATLVALEVISEPLKSMACTLVDVCAYAGTGNVLKIQHLLHICSEHDDSKDKENNEKKEEKKDDKKKKDDKDTDTKDSSNTDLSLNQGIAVLGIALVAMGEDIGSEMSFRAFGHLLRYGEVAIKRAVPLALGLISASDPKLQILDTLSKFSHDSDPEVAYNSILAMGLVGAGTNNARLAAMLRQLAVYHAKDPNNLFMVRLAQGLTHLGKGTLTLCPYHSDRALMSPVAVAGLLSVVVSCLDVKNLVLGKSHYVLYHLVSAMQPRMLTTFDEELRPLPVPVRVGQAVDVVGQAGKPKTITGFQTHTTPVLLAYGERAELATEEYLPLSPIMEGFVILKKNPDYEA
ncbi:hypothetical protein KUTeg_023221 [Tegillarca granosa]|uniref:26S proteasome non-ATPase regulatory subunit 2 n=1 Tax=Tegillarca granosa TaxID=220873 RepID=A0ABQ9E424_TEGGR|nr:hypothetical protein KUTeg_023221 [Tegillarca granosa]